MKISAAKRSVCLLLLLGGVLSVVFTAGCIFMNGRGENSNQSVNTTHHPTPNASLEPSATPTPVKSNSNQSSQGTPKPNSSPDIDAISDSLAIGNIAFNKPDSMELDKAAEIQLVLSPTRSPDELSGLIEEEGAVQNRSVKVSDYMEATLTGDNFTISNPTQRKLVSRSGVTEWRWDVTPTKEGQQRLHLTLSAIVNYENGEKPLEIKSFHEAIDVNVTFKQRLWTIASAIGRNMGWLWPGLLVPAAVWLWNRRKKKKGRPASKRRRKSKIETTDESSE